MNVGFNWKLCVMLLVLIAVSEHGTGQRDDDPNARYCMNTGNYTVNSTYSANLNATLAALSRNMPEYGFYNASVGEGEDRAYAVVLCRADLFLGPCRRCVGNAVVELVQLCPNQKQAIRWYDQCMLHYSNSPINGFKMDGAVSNLQTGDEVRNPGQFREDRDALANILRVKAANGSSLLKVGAGSRNTTDSKRIYLLLQCVPNLSQEDCNNCLSQVSQGLMSTTRGRKRISSCNLRYDVDLFYNETRLRELDALVEQMPNSPPGKSDGNAGEKKGDNTAIVVVIVVVTIVVCLILVACAAFFLRRRMKGPLEISESTEEMSDIESLQYDFRIISVATDDFNDANKLGQGGFGTVYRGELPNGQEIAVKRLSRDSGQGSKEFENEALLVAKLQHRNLVRLLGFSMERRERLLIYEFIQNASLDKFIFDPIKSSQVNWLRRRKIIEGIAKGLLYLHEGSRHRIIHRDLKSSNVLLDEEMNPKIADFGMARLFQQNEIQRNTTRIVGTYGYMPPEYAIFGQFSVKSDVFSFGVLVLEIISSKRSLAKNGKNVEDLLNMVWKHWRQGTIENVIDPMLRSRTDSIRDMLRCIHIGLLCIQQNVEDRPTMNSVVLMLSSSTMTLTAVRQPAFVSLSRFGPGGNLNYDSKESNSKVRVDTSEAYSSHNEISVTELHPR